METNFRAMDGTLERAFQALKAQLFLGRELSPVAAFFIFIRSLLSYS